MKRQKLTSSELLCGLCFALCFFAFMLTEAFINERCAVILGSGAVNPVYTVGLVCTGLGFLSFSLLRRLCKKEKSRKTAQIIIGVLCLGAAVVLLFAEQPALFLTSSSAALLLTGHISGCVYYNTAMYFLADIRERKYLPLSTVCTILLSSVCMFFLSDKVSYFAGTALMYLYSGFYVIFFTVMFLDFAPKSSRPELWAGMGRIVRSFTVAVAVLPALNIYGAVGNTVLAVVSCLLSILILLVLLPYLSSAAVSLKPIEELISGSPELSPQERLKLFAQYCSLTPRETEVLEKLLTTEDGVQEIADSLYISRRMVQRYISSIYEKTETKTRLGLFQSYMNFTAE